MTKDYRYQLVIEIESMDRGQRLAQDRLHSWLETYGHTGPGHGIKFVSVGVLTGKRLKSAPRRGDSK